MKVLIVTLIVCFVIASGGLITFAQEAHEGHQHEAVEEAELKAEGVEGPIEVGNTICPVSGEKVEEETAYKFEFEGKIYNLCCKMCAKDFEKDPQKYIEKLEEMEPEHEHMHEGHHDGHE